MIHALQKLRDSLSSVFRRQSKVECTIQEMRDHVEDHVISINENTNEIQEI